MAGICFSSSSSPFKPQISHFPRSLIIYPVSISRSQHLSTPRNLRTSFSLNNAEVPLKLVNANSCKKPRGLLEFRSAKVTQLECTRRQGEALNEEGWSNGLLQRGDLLSSGFPLCVALACFAGLARPQAFLWIRGKWQIAGLTLTMLGMGMTLSLKDLQGALAMPREILGGVLLQYTVMPISGALVSKLLGLPSHYAAGLVLVACCPGGTASNVVTYIARGNVALSVLMTAASTFLAVVMTPFLTAKLAGQYVAVDAGGLFVSTLQVILIPVLTGAIMNQYIPTVVSKLSPFTPLVAVITVSALCASAIAQNASAILSSGGQVIVAVGALHSAGYVFGYLLSKLLGFDGPTSRTISIEVGMQACL
ncbi:hypothetical protein KI387_024248 [Taxus chinensis]|uniref:Uncharacterized protein n=1 Tax=Taxus chinensis TaxID=29808 RepID=A0AA38L8R0_TAXCH|nr:hypothetical protein KI387_024248 [Taxus chinensis]